MSKAGDVRRWRVEGADAPGRVGRDAEHDVEHVDQHQAADESRCADANGAKQAHAVVDDRAWTERGERAQGNREAQGEEQCHEGQFQRSGQSLCQIDGDRLAGGHRTAQIAGRDIPQIEDQLLRNGAVQAHRDADLLDLLGTGGGGRREEDRWIAREHPHEQEGENQHARQRRQ